MKTATKAFILTAAAAAAANVSAAVKNGKKYGDWNGVCKDGSCAIVQVNNNDKGQPVGQVAIRRYKEAQNQPVAVILLPLRMNLQAGVGVAVDGKQIARFGYEVCTEVGCQASLPLTPELQAKLKAGKKLQVAAFFEDKQLTLEYSLKGFSSALKDL